MNTAKKNSFHEGYVNWKYDHPVGKFILENLWILLLSTASALIFAFGFVSFMKPDLLMKELQNDGVDGNEILRLVSGGMSGICQNIALLLSIIFKGTEIKVDENLIYSIFYFGLNVPLFVLAWKNIGKRFAIWTLINVAQVSLFTYILALPNMDWVYYVSKYVNDNGAMLARALFAGVCTGLSSGLAYKADISAGGVDVVAYYISMRKETSTGKYSFLLNTITLICFCVLTATDMNWTANSMSVLAIAFYSFLYLFSVMLVVDFIHIRNKKAEIKIITAVPELSDLLLARIPHGATLLKGVGAYTKEEKTIISTVISTSEVDEIISIVRKYDPKAFVQVTDVHHVYGRFFMKPIK